ncbi:MAG: uracil-DNA glycosylase [Bacteriovoracia bacterium]
MEAVSNASFPDNLPPAWKAHLAGQAEQAYFKQLTTFLVREHQAKQKIYPQRAWILRALQMVDYDQVKVVILGQDPYHGAGQAIGLSFGVPNDLFPKPPSLQNIFKELESDLGVKPAKEKSDLTGWAAQGVLLLNAVLTVRHGQAFSHRDAGWEQFTDYVIQRLNERETPVVFILWGAAAQRKKALITNPRHFMIESPHPSPLSASRGFFGSRPFSKVNEILEKKLGVAPIEWARTST